jgi:hypothetical protein
VEAREDRRVQRGILYKCVIRGGNRIGRIGFRLDLDWMDYVSLTFLKEIGLDQDRINLHIVFFQIFDRF